LINGLIAKKGDRSADLKPLAMSILKVKEELIEIVVD
jgi:hypothetical protein